MVGGLGVGAYVMAVIYLPFFFVSSHLPYADSPGVGWFSFFLLFGLVF
jgi:hypothetical protein